ncbi:MAG: ABC transporter substrate-binding protein [Pusillimonas sp.]
MKLLKKTILFSLTAMSCSLALASDITIGVTISATGPGAALGGPQKSTTELFPKSVAGKKINWIVLDDTTDPTVASRNVSKFINENKADVIIGSSTTANTASFIDTIVASKTPVMALAPLELPPEKDHWVFKMPQNNNIMGQALVEHMTATGVKSLGIIAFGDIYGDLWIKAMTPMLEAAGIKLSAIERYNRTDTSVVGQTLKLLGAKPDAVLVAGGGTPAALPHVTLVERGYKGQIYQTHGAPSSAFLRVGGSNVEGGIFVAGPLLAHDQLPDSAPTKKTIVNYVTAYEEKFGLGSLSSFGGHMWDAWAVLEQALPKALDKATPGTEQFRVALRDALEASKDVVGVHGIYNMSPEDHFGHDERSRVLLRAENGTFKLLPATNK